MSTDWQTLASADDVAQEACRLICEAAKQAITQRGSFKLVLAGGSTPEATYRLLAQQQQDWQHWHIWFGDERCLPSDHADRNSLMADQAWLSRVPIPKDQVHPIPAELGPREGARAYAAQVKQNLPFDLVLLGMGEDGHTASLFPGHAHPAGQMAVAVYNAPKPPPERISLATEALGSCREMLVLICGSNKQAAIAKWAQGETLPVSQVVNTAEHAIVMMDEAASAERAR